jgi:hypothetical protein
MNDKRMIDSEIETNAALPDRIQLGDRMSGCWQ